MHGAGRPPVDTPPSGRDPTYDRPVILDPTLSALDVCDLETTGRRTGSPRVVELWFAADPTRDRVYFLSGGRDAAQWVRNARQAPAVRVRLGDRWFRGSAREVEGTEDETAARRLLAAKYQGWRDGRPLSGWATTSLPVAVDLVP
jgi:deazaflavin-dependent oxidoreductase (nitroreductase family)